MTVLSPQVQRFSLSKRLLILITLAMMPVLHGCALVVAGGAAGATMVAMDERKVGTQVDDNHLRVRVLSELNQYETLAEQRVLVVVYNSNVLLYGQTSDQRRRDQAVRAVRDVKGINRVYDQLRVTTPVSFMQRSRDTLLTSRVKTTLLADRDFDHSGIKVYTEAGEVFLVGISSREGAADAIEKARNVSSVERVIDVIERQ